MKKHIFYPIFVIFSLFLIFSVLILSLRKVGPHLNPPRQASFQNLQQAHSISVRKNQDQWQFAEATCSPSSLKHECDAFNWKPLSDLVLPETSSSKGLLVHLNQDMSKENAVDFLSQLAALNLLVEQLFISSRFDSSLSNMRKADPSLLFGITLTQVMRWSLFAQLGIESVYPVEADFIVSDKKIRSLMQGKIEAEVERRRIPFTHTAPL